MAMDESAKRAKLITLLNVANARSATKRKVGEDWHEIARRVKKERLAASNGSKGATSLVDAEINNENGEEAEAAEEPEDDDEDAKSDERAKDEFKLHFATETALLTPQSMAAAEEGKWKVSRESSPTLGRLAKSSLEASTSASAHEKKPILHPRLKDKLDTYTQALPSKALPVEFLSLIGDYHDLLHSRMDHDSLDAFRAVTSLHAMNHINKTRQRVLKDNEALAANADSNDRETRDQGFTRPKVLILVPFRNTALEWMQHITHFSLATQIENNARFQKDFALPEGAVDKLAVDEKDAEGNSKYPRDHRETFKGNIDDSFRVGMKVTRKSLKLYSEFYQSDLIVASPLGLRMSIEKEKSADFLSSIEIIIADQLDVMQMQNWEHVQFIFDHLNQIPKEAHGCDFARVKPWYLDGQAAFLRQSILFSAHESPEIRGLFNKKLTNVAGKVKTEQTYEGVLSKITPGVKQTFARYESTSVQADDDARFEYFTTKTLPALLRSAVASSRTLIFVPSYFDFVRLNAHLKNIDDLDYAVLSEYSSNSEISRARTNFYKGKKSFLVVTERFHFFRRYKIRGARTVVFYAPPEHADFYAEYLQYPFLKQQVSGSSKNRPDAEDTEEVLEAAEVSSQTIFSKYDYLRLERIVGSQDARRMCTQEQGERFSFV